MRRNCKNRRPRRFLESNNSTGANQQRQLAQNGNRIRKPHQNQTAHGCVEGFICGDLGNIGLDKAHIMQASFSHASPRAVEGALVALDSHNLSRKDQPILPPA